MVAKIGSTGYADSSTQSTPGHVVMGVAETGRGVAAEGRAATVSDAERDALGLRVEATPAPDVEDHGRATEDDGGRR